jgi:glycosyltransferase involved in cell wall biosynthesis
MGKRIEDLIRCINALNHQIMRDFEIVLVFPKDYEKPYIHLKNLANPIPINIILQDGKGISNARNCGVKASQGEIVAFTDDDAEPYPDWLQNINQHFEKNPHMDYLGGEFTLEVNNIWQKWIDQSYHLSDVDIERGLCHGNNMAYRIGVFDYYLFDENILFGADEAEFQMRLKKNGYLNRNFQDVMINHQHRSDFLSFTKMRWGYAQGHVYLYEYKFKQCLFNWNDLMNVGFFISLFYSLLLFRTIEFSFIPITLLVLIFIHEYKDRLTLDTLFVQVYVSFLWTLSKMYHSFKNHLGRWGVIDSGLWVWN